MRSESPWTLSTKLTTVDVINRDIIKMRQTVYVGDQFEILVTDFSFWKGDKLTKKVTYIMILPPTSKNRYQYIVCCISMSKVFSSRVFKCCVSLWFEFNTYLLYLFRILHYYVYRELFLKYRKRTDPLCIRKLGYSWANSVGIIYNLCNRATPEMRNFGQCLCLNSSS